MLVRWSSILAVVVLLASAAPATAVQSTPQPCPHVFVSADGSSVSARDPALPPGPLTTSSAAYVSASGLDCSDATYILTGALVADDLAHALDERAGLQGFGPLRIESMRRRSLGNQDVVTVTAFAPPASRLTFTTPAPLRIDRAILRAGQHVNFQRGNKANICTMAWTVRKGRALFGLTAGHCSGGGERVLRVRGENEPPRRRLGPVTWNGDREDGPDALAIALSPTLLAHQAVERGNLRPWTVTGWLKTSRQDEGMRVCFAGRSSGADRCGKIVKPKFKRGRRRLVCTDLDTRGGDSGGPVYTEPERGAVKALGIVKGSRPNFPPFSHGESCYTPIETILDEFDARLPVGPRVLR